MMEAPKMEVVWWVTVVHGNAQVIAMYSAQVVIMWISYMNV